MSHDPSPLGRQKSFIEHKTKTRLKLIHDRMSMQCLQGQHKPLQKYPFKGLLTNSLQQIEQKHPFIMNSPASLDISHLEHSSSSLNPLIHMSTHRKNLFERSQSPDKLSESELPSEDVRHSVKNRRQMNTYTNGFRITSKMYTHLPPVRLGSLREKFKSTSESHTRLVLDKSVVEILLLNKDKEETVKEPDPVVEINQAIVTPRKQNILKKTKTFRQQKQDNQSRLESNLRIQVPNVNGDVTKLMGYYNKKMKHQLDVKVFVFNSQDDYIKRVLLHWGWVENKILDSPFYHLKWTYMDSQADHKSVNGQLLNHFKNNQQLTSKGGLMKNTKNFVGFQANLEQFVPRSYDLGSPSDCDSFHFQHQRTTLLVILKKHYKLVVEKMDHTLLSSITQSIKIKSQENLKRWRKKKYSPVTLSRNKSEALKYEDTKHPRQDFLVNINLVITCLRYFRHLMKSNEDEDWGNPEGFLSYKRQEIAKHLPSLKTYSKMNPPYAGLDQKEFSRQYLGTPSITMVRKIVKYHLYFQSKYAPIWKSDGIDNVWVVKPANNSKGNGIYLHNDSWQILDSSEGYSRIVQKYIQTPLICNNPRYQLLYQKKFDIRQWVLVTSYNPLKAYVFSSCYLRICSQTYQIRDIKNLQKHLTNYSTNKSNFCKKQQSVESLQNFKQYLREDHRTDWDTSLKPRIHAIIANTLVSCSEQIQVCTDKFQMYGFDILIDSQLNPWLLEVNLSPACQERCPFLREYCEVMGEQLLRLVLPSNYCPDVSLNCNQSNYSWEKLSVWYDQKKKEPQLQVVGTRANLRYQKQLDTSHLQHLAAIKIQSVFMMQKPKSELKRLKKLKLSRGLQRYFQSVLNRSRYTRIAISLAFPVVESYLITTAFLPTYSGKLGKYHTETISKYAHTPPIVSQFKSKQLSLSIKSIQSVYQHFKTVSIIVSHKHSTCNAVKIQRFYRRHYKRRVLASNLIKRCIKDHLYQINRKQFLHELQVCQKEIKLAIYLRGMSDRIEWEGMRRVHYRGAIHDGIRGLLAVRECTRRKLSIFQRLIGRVLRVNTRRTRTYYFPAVRDYAEEKVRVGLGLQRYLSVLLAAQVLRKKTHKKRSKAIYSYLRSFAKSLAYQRRFLDVETTAEGRVLDRLQPEPLEVPKQSARPRIQQKAEEKSQSRLRRQEDEERFFNYLSRAKQTRGRSSVNSRRRH